MGKLNNGQLMRGIRPSLWNRAKSVRVALVLQYSLEWKSMTL